MTDTGRRAQLMARINRLPVAVSEIGDGDGVAWRPGVLTVAELKALAEIQDAMATRTEAPPDAPTLQLFRAADRRWFGELVTLPAGLAVIYIAGDDFEGGRVEAVEPLPAGPASGAEPDTG